MKVKINQILVSEDGKTPLVEKNKPLSLKQVCIASVLNPVKEDDFNKKIEKYNIWKRLLASNDNVDLSSEEITILKQSIDKCFAQIVLGQAVEMLEQKI